jgi:hypothetical protein
VSDLIYIYIYISKSKEGPLKNLFCKNKSELHAGACGNCKGREVCGWRGKESSTFDTASAPFLCGPLPQRASASSAVATRKQHHKRRGTSPHGQRKLAPMLPLFAFFGRDAVVMFRHSAAHPHLESTSRVSNKCSMPHAACASRLRKETGLRMTQHSSHPQPGTTACCSGTCAFGV